MVTWILRLLLAFPSWLAEAGMLAAVILSIGHIQHR